LTDLSVVVVTWNTKEMLRRCLRSVLSGTCGLALEATVVDNGSSDGTVEMLADEFPSVRVIANGRNLGFAAAANQGIVSSGARYVLLLNADTECVGDAVPRMIDFMDERPKVAALGCKLVNPDGSIQPSCYSDASAWKALAIASALYDVLPFRLMERLNPDGLIRRIADFPDHETVLFPVWFRGACMMLRTDAVKQCGGFDEEFFTYFEETDLCYRLRTDGWQVAYTPRACFIHHGDTCLRYAYRQMTMRFWKSYFLLCEKHGPAGDLAKLRVAMLLGTLIKLMNTFLSLALGVKRAAERFRTCGALLKWGLATDRRGPVRNVRGGKYSPSPSKQRITPRA
jgi:GT2 family glycosyltransferase